MTDSLSPAGSSTYSSNTMYVGDGTWDSGKNDFLLPNLVGLNFATMQYNGMGNRFSSLSQYHSLIKGHGVIAAITFLFIVPAAIFMARYHTRNPRRAIHAHIYLQILTVALTTVVFVLGWFAVGPNRSLTNPHHGIGLAIYVMVLFQAISGWFVHGREKKKVMRRLSIRAMLHQWLGRAIALLGIAQIPLGLTLYGSPKILFILYTLWMTFLLVLFFVLSYRKTNAFIQYQLDGRIEGRVIPERRRSSFGGVAAPLALGAGLGALLGRKKNRERSRSRSRSRSRHDSQADVLPSRRGSRRDSRRDSVSSYTEEEKYEDRRHEGGGAMGTVMKGAAALGAGALAAKWFGGRQKKKHEEEYSPVAPDTPSRRPPPRRPMNVPSELSESSVDFRRGGRRPPGPILPGPLGPRNPAMAAAAYSAAEPRPSTARPHTPRAQTPPRTPTRHRLDSLSSHSSDYSSEYDSPSRRQEEGHGLGKGLLAGLGVGWIASKFKGRRDRKAQKKADEERLEEERRLEAERREGMHPARFTGDSFPPRSGGRGELTESSHLTSDISQSHVEGRHGPMPPLPAGVMPGAAAGRAAHTHERSRQDVTAPAAMPPAPPDPAGILHVSASEISSSEGHTYGRPADTQRPGTSGSAGIGAAAAAESAVEEEHRRAEAAGGRVTSPPVTLRVQMHDDSQGRVTLQRLNDQEAAAERRARREQRRRKAESVSSLSGADTAASRRRYRREETARRSGDEMAAEQRIEAGPPPAMAPLSPPNPAFAGGRRPKDSAYYSGQPGMAPQSFASLASPESQSHGTWSAMSPGSPSAGPSGESDAAERRRRRRMERQQRPTGHVEFS